MTKQLTPEEKKALGIVDTSPTPSGGLTPEQIAANLENQKNILKAQEKNAPTQDVAPAPGKNDSEKEANDQEVFDLDNVLDQAEHTYEKKESSLEDITETGPAPSDDDLEEVISHSNLIDSTLGDIEQPQENVREQKSRTEEKIDHVRTLHKDVAELQNTGSVTMTAQMLRDARTEEAGKKEDASTDTQIKTFSIISVLFVIVALGVFIYVTKFYRPASTSALAPTNNIPALLPFDTQIPIDVTGAYHFKIKSTLAEKIAEQTDFKKLSHFYFGEASRNGGRLLATNDFFEALNILPPLSLQEVITDQFMFGTYTVDTPEPFLILPVTSFVKAQNTLLEWEKNMLRDFKDIFALDPQLTQPEAFESTFRNELVANQTIRSLYVPLVTTQEETFVVPEIIPVLESADGEIQNTETAPAEEISLEEDATSQEDTPADDVATTNEDSASEGVILAQETEEGTPTEDSETENAEDVITEEEPVVETPQELLTRIGRTTTGEERALVYAFINEYTVVITTSPEIIPELVRRYSNRQIFLR
ncbi:MAG: hypothetical protein KBC22_02850 [Candidatus Pacebacteria bacterium]|nr:hypothetical protein [Candidatus Paceibacterota bacterium]